MIDSLELLGFALAMLLVSKGDVKLAAIGGANIGRDADTISGRAAMLAGTISGYSNIPPEWVELVNKNSLDRIKTAARKMEELIIYKKLPMLKARNE
jgi:ADP-ribosylglycohydrolase